MNSLPLKSSLLFIGLFLVICGTYVYSTSSAEWKKIAPGLFDNRQHIMHANGWYIYYGLDRSFEYIPAPLSQSSILSSIPEEESHIVFAMDVFEDNSSSYEISGWAYIPNSNIDKAKIYLSLNSKKHNYLFETNSLKRVDVQKAHGLDSPNTGYKILVDKSDIATATYEIGLFVIINDSTKSYIRLKESIEHIL